MKRRPEKNYKLPKYAAGLAAVLVAGGMTGCTETAGDVQIDGGIDVPEESTEVVELAGDVEFVEDTTEASTEETTEETMLDGDVAVLPEEEIVEVTLAGDAVLAPEETCIIPDSAETGVAEFTFPDTEPAPPRPEPEIVTVPVGEETAVPDVELAVPGLFVVETE